MMWEPPVISDEDRELAVLLVMQGYEQTSRRYRMVARLPEGMTGRQALVARGGRWASSGIDDDDRRAADQYRRVYAREDEQRTLTESQFAAFLAAKASASWQIDWPFDPADAPPMFGNGRLHHVQTNGPVDQPRNGVTSYNRLYGVSGALEQGVYVWCAGNFGIMCAVAKSVA